MKCICYLNNIGFKFTLVKNDNNDNNICKQVINSNIHIFLQQSEKPTVINWCQSLTGKNRLTCGQAKCKNYDLFAQAPHRQQIKKQQCV